MKYRKLDENGDYLFGSEGEFHENTPEGVAQAIRTRLLLLTEEWFLDSNEGTPYDPDIVGYGTATTRDPAIIDRILGTPGVREIPRYSSSVNQARAYRVDALVDTIYGQVLVTSAQGATLAPAPPPIPPPLVPLFLFHISDTPSGGGIAEFTGG